MRTRTSIFTLLLCAAWLGTGMGGCKKGDSAKEKRNQAKAKANLEKLENATFVCHRPFVTLEFGLMTMKVSGKKTYKMYNFKHNFFQVEVAERRSAGCEYSIGGDHLVLHCAAAIGDLPATRITCKRLKAALKGLKKR